MKCLINRIKEARDLNDLETLHYLAVLSNKQQNDTRVELEKRFENIEEILHNLLDLEQKKIEDLKKKKKQNQIFKNI